jgi:hypothetical protein
MKPENIMPDAMAGNKRMLLELLRKTRKRVETLKSPWRQHKQDDLRKSR